MLQKNKPPPFQNLNTTWYTEYPDFTVCFQRTVLVWTACAVLWVFSLLDLFYIKNAMNRNIPWGVLNVSKLIITGALILLTVVDLCMAASHNSDGNIYPVDFYTPAIKIVTFVSKVFVLNLPLLNYTDCFCKRFWPVFFCSITKSMAYERRVCCFCFGFLYSS